jgi:hypothetical protein
MFNMDGALAGVRSPHVRAALVHLTAGLPPNQAALRIHSKEALFAPLFTYLQLDLKLRSFCNEIL